MYLSEILGDPAFVRLLLEGFGRNLLITVCACILPMAVGFVAMRLHDVKKPTYCAAWRAFECLPPLVLMLAACFALFPYSRDTLWLCVVALSVSHIGYIPVRMGKGRSPRDYFARVIDLCADVFKWSTAVGYVAVIDIVRASDVIRSRTYIGAAALAPLIPCALFLGVLQVVRYFLVERKEPFTDDSPRSKLAAALLAILVGTTGAHRYYLGYPVKGFMLSCCWVAGVAMNVMLIVSNYGSRATPGAGRTVALVVLGALLAAAMIWSVIDFIRILTGSLKPRNGRGYR